MELTIRLFAGLRERAGTGALTLAELPDGLDVAGLKRELESRHPELGSLEHVRGVVDRRWVPDETPLEGAREVGLLPPVSGGRPPAERETDDALTRGVFEIHAAPLDPAAALVRVGHASCGANVVFTGTTRATNRGEAVQRLDYEAFEEMAGEEMARIFDACRREVAGDPADPERALRMLVLHRTGTVEVGAPSVVVAVASPHRDAAFRAARYLIDELKRSVPLWKKEVYEGGHHWIGERS